LLVTAGEAVLTEVDEGGGVVLVIIFVPVEVVEVVVTDDEVVVVVVVATASLEAEVLVEVVLVESSSPEFEPSFPESVDPPMLLLMLS